MFFYVALDDYPLHYVTPWLDQNDIWMLRVDEKDYALRKGKSGTYYARVLPDFALADIIDERIYKFRYYAFS